MSKILVIGAGGVSSVAIHKMAQLSKDFKEITLASRTIDNCKKIQKQIKKKYNCNINIEELDADNIYETSNIISNIENLDQNLKDNKYVKNIVDFIVSDIAW